MAVSARQASNRHRLFSEIKNSQQPNGKVAFNLESGTQLLFNKRRCKSCMNDDLVLAILFRIQLAPLASFPVSNGILGWLTFQPYSSSLYFLMECILSVFRYFL